MSPRSDEYSPYKSYQPRSPRYQSSNEYLADNIRDINRQHLLNENEPSHDQDSDSSSVINNHGSSTEDHVSCSDISHSDIYVTCINGVSTTDSNSNGFIIYYMDCGNLKEIFSDEITDVDRVLITVL